MKIREIMSEPPVVCVLADTLNTAAQLMWENDCGAVPVIDSAGSVVGMITDRDVCMAAYTRGGCLRDSLVSDAMATEVFSCRADDSLEAVEKVMGEKQIRRLPVLNGDNRPIGVVSLIDIVRNTASRKKNGHGRELTQTLTSISQPAMQAMQLASLAPSHEASNRVV